MEASTFCIQAMKNAIKLTAEALASTSYAINWECLVYYPPKHQQCTRTFHYQSPHWKRNIPLQHTIIVVSLLLLRLSELLKRVRAQANLSDFFTKLLLQVRRQELLDKFTYLLTAEACVFTHHSEGTKQIRWRTTVYCIGVMPLTLDIWLLLRVNAG